MKKIFLNTGEFAIVDDEDFGWLNDHKWHVWTSKSGNKYACRSVMVNRERNYVRMHRTIVEKRIGRKLGKHEQVDHRNNNGLDNRRENLRITNAAGNARNRKALGKLGYKGVAFHSKLTERPWEACIKIGKRRISLGCYETLEEAAKIYDWAAIHYFGEFARLNFPNA